MSQTAVEWLQELYDSRPAYEEFITDEEFEQAKQMEKEQIKEAYEFGKQDEYKIGPDSYYNGKFNQNK